MRPVELGPSPAASEVLAPMVKKVRAANDNAKSEVPADPRAVLERVMENDPRFVLDAIRDRAAARNKTEAADAPMDLEAALRIASDRKRREQARGQCVALINEASKVLAGLSEFVQGDDADEVTFERVSKKLRLVLGHLDEHELILGRKRDTWARELLNHEIEMALHYAEMAEELGLKYDPVADIKREYSRDFPDLAAKLRDEDVRIALEVWNKHGRPAKGLPSKSKHMVALLDRLGIGNVASPKAFKTSLSKQKRVRRDRSPGQREKG